MANTTTATCLPLFPSLEMAWRDVDSSFERFCLTAEDRGRRANAARGRGAAYRRAAPSRRRPRRPPLESHAIFACSLIPGVRSSSP